MMANKLSLNISGTEHLYSQFLTQNKNTKNPVDKRFFSDVPEFPADKK
jgi:hypothetical protein